MPIIFGASFIQKEPNNFECLDSQDDWQPCTKEHICGAGLTQDQYRVVPDDDTYDNWVQQMDLLCVDKYLIGLTNSMFFIGVIISCLVIPPLADAYGRKIPFLVSIGITILVYLTLIFTYNLYVAYAMIFILGLSFAGRMVVGVNYALEFFLTKAHNPALLTFMLGLNIHKLIINCWFQFIDKSVTGMLSLYIVLAVILLIVLWWLVPESPKWLYVNF